MRSRGTTIGRRTPPCSRRSLLKERLRRAIAAVDSDDASLFLLRHVEGLSIEELAGMFQIEKNNVAVRLHRIRHRLQAEMERRRGERVRARVRKEDRRCPKTVWNERLQEMKEEDVDTGTLEAARARVWEKVTNADSATCAEFRQDFRAYLGKELGGSRRILVEDHLSRCPSCRARSPR